jgi:hypothetical protein
VKWCRQLTVLFGCAVLAGCAGLTGCAGAPPAVPTAAPVVSADGDQVVEVTYAGGAVRGGVLRYPVPRGAAVQLVVHSDVADRVHLHGYDRTSYVTAGASTTIRFVVDRDGVFPVELEQRAAPLAELQVTS